MFSAFVLEGEEGYQQVFCLFETHLEEMKDKIKLYFSSPWTQVHD